MASRRQQDRAMISSMLDQQKKSSLGHDISFTFLCQGSPAPEKSRGMLCQGGPAPQKSRGMLCQGALPLRKVEECYARGRALRNAHCAACTALCSLCASPCALCSARCMPCAARRALHATHVPCARSAARRKLCAPEACAA